MLIREFIIEENRVTKNVANTSAKLIESVNAKIRNLQENIMPAPPPKHVWQSSMYKEEWIKYRRELREYQMRYNDGTKYGKLKMTALPKFISESFVENLREDAPIIEEIVSRAFSFCVPADKLKIGKKYDVAVVRLDHITRTLEVDIIHEQTVDNIRHIKTNDEWIVSTSGGLLGPTSVQNISEQIETLYFDSSNRLDSAITFLETIISPEHAGWKLNTVSDRDISKNESIDSIDEDSLMNESTTIRPHNPEGIRNWREIQRAMKHRGPENDPLHDATLRFGGFAAPPITKSSTNLRRLYGWCKRRLDNDIQHEVFDVLADIRRLNQLMVSGLPLRESARVPLEVFKQKNLVIFPSEITVGTQQLPAAPESMWNSLGFQWNERGRYYWIPKSKMLDQRVLERVKAFLKRANRELKPNEYPTIFTDPSKSTRFYLRKR